MEMFEDDSSLNRNCSTRLSHDTKISRSSRGDSKWFFVMAVGVTTKSLCDVKVMSGLLGCCTTPAKQSATIAEILAFYFETHPMNLRRCALWTSRGHQMTVVRFLGIWYG